MNCPICGAEAQNATPGDFDGLIVDCRHCGNYQIRDEALNDFLRLDFDARRSALERVKQSAKPGARPSIDRSCL
jgi:rRNA maturation protein Nop10